MTDISFLRLEPQTDNEQLKLEIIAELRATSIDAERAINDLGHPDVGCYWGEYDIELSNLSRKYPDIVIKLIGEDDEGEDLWHEYFKNGKSQRCNAIVTFQPYNENALS